MNYKKKERFLFCCTNCLLFKKKKLNAENEKLSLKWISK